MIQKCPDIPSRLGTTLGAIFIGATIAAVFYGITTLQTVVYYKQKPNDPWLFRYTLPFYGYLIRFMSPLPLTHFISTLSNHSEIIFPSSESFGVFRCSCCSICVTIFHTYSFSFLIIRRPSYP
ncbi:hypothetical protein EDD18DRAFT_157015 [Armillaria luteobubalina]|uniref:Uncharacterized protein n=1 Tax=Armillaria luteobubalina TaxID=153913 RepID=A0AA39Q9P5_9AGAR|nr:hypothetical protein EDD18DRAFT_157015 [Armillaria luteobubalina]